MLKMSFPFRCYWKIFKHFSKSWMALEQCSSKYIKLTCKSIQTLRNTTLNIHGGIENRECYICLNMPQKVIYTKVLWGNSGTSRKNLKTLWFPSSGLIFCRNTFFDWIMETSYPNHFSCYNILVKPLFIVQIIFYYLKTKTLLWIFSIIMYLLIVVQKINNAEVKHLNIYGHTKN